MTDVFIDGVKLCGVESVEFEREYEPQELRDLSGFPTSISGTFVQGRISKYSLMTMAWPLPDRPVVIPSFTPRTTKKQIRESFDEFMKRWEKKRAYELAFEMKHGVTMDMHREITMARFVKMQDRLDRARERLWND